MMLRLQTLEEWYGLVCFFYKCVLQDEKHLQKLCLKDLLNFQKAV